MGDIKNTSSGEKEHKGDVCKNEETRLQIEPELLEIFSEESHYHLNVLENICDVCVREEKGLSVGEELLLSLHTLKGSAHTVNVPEIAHFCELLESYAKKMREVGRVIPVQMLPMFREAINTIRQILSALHDSKISFPDTSALLVTVKRLLEESSNASENSIEGRRINPKLQKRAAVEEGQPLLNSIVESCNTPEVTEERGIPDNPNEQDFELVEVYLEEAAELLDEIDNSLQAWTENPEDKNVVKELQRQLHTLKGGARMAGFSNIGDLSHALESLIVAVVDQRIKRSQQVFELLQHSLDSLNLMQDSAQNGQPVYPVPDLLQSIERLRKVGSETDSNDTLIADNSTIKLSNSSQKIDTNNNAFTAKRIVDEGAKPQSIDPPQRADSKQEPGSVINRDNASYQELIRIRATLVDRLVNNAGEVNIFHARIGQQITSFGFNLKELDQTVIRLRSQLRKLEMETEAQILFSYEKERDEENANFDPLELDRYSVMQQLSRALSESVSDLVSIQEILINVVKDAETLLLQQSRISTDLQEGLMRARMTQFSTMGPRLRRIARQTASELSKKVNLTIGGEGTELDRSVLDRMVAPLEHMLRNAVSHGIETPEQRQIRGKTPEGNVHISVAREASEVVIKVKDDGAGININSVRAKAEKKGLINAENNLPDYDIMQLILESGFSTAEEITQISGRGVGLDVVNSEIKELSGVLSINSIEGKGTTFIVRLPFTLAINQALLVQSGDNLYAVPLASLEGVVRLSSEELRKKYSYTSPMYEYGDNKYELKHLGAMLGMSQPVLGEMHSVFPVLLVRSGDYRVALQVEGLLGSREVVVKPVGPQISKLRGISGATILGDGRVVLILDVPGLIRLGAGVQLVYSAKEKSAQAKASSLAKVMVVDDSITIRKFTSRMLERNNFEATTAKDGIDAMGKLQDDIPDLILLDIEMPRMDGYELATHIRNTESLKKIPIIMITSRTGEKHRVRAIELGVNRYLGKPYKETELLENIREILELEDTDLKLTKIV